MTELDKKYLKLKDIHRRLKKRPEKKNMACVVSNKLKELERSGKISEIALEMAAYYT